MSKSRRPRSRSVAFRMSRWPWPMSGPRRPRLMSWPRRFRPRSRRVCMFTSGRIPRQNRLHTGLWIKRGRAPRMSSPPGRRVWPRWSTLWLNICPRRQKLSRNRSISLKGYIHGSHWPGWYLSCNVYIRNINTRSLSDRIRIRLMVSVSFMLSNVSGRNCNTDIRKSCMLCIL